MDCPTANSWKRFAQNRDEAAFEVLVWRDGPMVLSLCQRLLRNRHDAEDATQATFLILARKAASIGQGAAVSSWLYKVALRVALRAKTRTPIRTTDLSQIPDIAAPDPVQEELRQVLDEAIAQLPERYRTVIVQHYFQGRASKELAERLGCPIGTVTARLSRSRELLRRLVSRRGVSVPAVVLGAALTQAGASGAVSASLVTTTVRTAALISVGQSVTPVVSTQAVLLAEEVAQTMFLSKLKVVTVVLLLALATVMGTGLAAYQILAPGPEPIPRSRRSNIARRRLDSREVQGPESAGYGSLRGSVASRSHGPAGNGAYAAWWWGVLHRLFPGRQDPGLGR